MIRRRASVLVLLAVVATAFVGIAGSAGAKEVKDTGPLGLVPRLDATRPPSYVGVDSAGRLLGISLIGETELVAYVCDGEKTGVWFQGKFADGDPSATLESKGGDTLTVDLTSDPLSGTVTIDGTEATFTLTPAVGAAGLFRERHGKRVSGWVVDNNGAIWGITEDGRGKVVATVQQGTPSSSPPAGSGSGSGASGADPVAQGFFKCAAAQFRLEREKKKLANGGSSGGSFTQAEDAVNAACPN